jgi:hypothetical protein
LVLAEQEVVLSVVRLLAVQVFMEWLLVAVEQVDKVQAVLTGQ